MAKARKKRSPEYMKITPTKARNWLDGANTHNRRLSLIVVERFARDMRAGRWISRSHQGIAFSENGVLLDGQHRLAAIVAAGVPIWMYVWFKQPEETQFVIDQGPKRNVADVLTLHGGYGQVTNYDMATLRAMIRGFGEGHKRTAAEEGELFLSHRDAIRFVQDEFTAHGRIPGISSGTTRGVIARAYYTADREALRHFCQILKTGMGAGQKDRAIVLLWQYLVQSTNKGQDRDSLRQRYGKTERALYAFLKGEPIKKLFAANDELFPLP